MPSVGTKNAFLKLRVGTEELARWKEVAGPGGLSPWLRRVVNEECDRFEAEESDAAYARQERIHQLETMSPGIQRAADVGGRKPFTPDFK